MGVVLPHQNTFCKTHMQLHSTGKAAAEPERLHTFVAHHESCRRRQQKLS